MTDAPDFGRDGHDYPSGGERLGPAWQAMWDAMSDREWWEPKDLAVVAEPWVASRTVENLLRQAWKAKHLQKCLMPTPRARKHWVYRRKELQVPEAWR